MLISDEIMKKMPSKDDFYNRLKKLGIVDEQGNVDMDRIDVVAEMPNVTVNHLTK